ncbi:MAG: OmpH family outer membrane protein [Bacteroidia bacterium]|nr:OmpH family outer membrane protein [Bacteroidia bacterium]
MKKLAIYLFLLVSVFVVTFIPANAQTKIGYFDLNLVLPQLPEFKQAQADMETYGRQVEEELKAKQGDFDKKLKDYQDKMDKGELTQALQQSKESELQSLQRQFQEFQQQIQVEAQNREQKLLSPIYEKVEKAIQEVAKENNYAFIIKRESFASVVDANGVSNMVLKKLGVTPAAGN